MNSKVISIFFLLLLIWSCSKNITPFNSEKKVAQIYLTNEIEFKSAKAIKGVGSAFLIKYKSKTYACTARHVVESRVNANRLNEELLSWKMYPKNKANNVVQIDSLVNANNLKDEWWLLAVAKADPNIKQLKPQFKKVTIGKAVYFVGCPYIEKDCVQQVYTGKVISVIKNKIGVSLDEPTNVSGFSGAPLLDKDGYLIGLITQAKFGKGKKAHTVFAESTEYLKTVLVGL